MNGRAIGERSVDVSRPDGSALDAPGITDTRPAHASAPHEARGVRDGVAAPGRDRLDHTTRHDGSAPAG
ncbi:hypothetical protein OG985_10485 [Streptomyces sp. NBC_00289]|uniref:hypothetical protein n=1 Tax=Streptomyces sp. NBC_00289 TaxID=2975703 RepID=UPI003251CCE0